MDIDVQDRNRTSSRNLLELFTAHPASVGETYRGHLRAAFGIALRLLAGGLGCLVHALLPFLLQRVASDCIRELHERLTVRTDTRQARQ
jgi:hypothetical protein